MRPPVASIGTQSIPPICQMCQKRHHGECRRFSTGCFHYGQEGHFIRECPQRIGAETSVASLATPVPEMSTQKSTGRRGLYWMRFQLLESSQMCSRMILRFTSRKRGGFHHLLDPRD